MVGENKILYQSILRPSALVIKVPRAGWGLVSLNWNSRSTGAQISRGISLRLRSLAVRLSTIIS